MKPQSAFFEECGPEGVRTLARVIRRAREAGLDRDLRRQAGRHRLDGRGLRGRLPGRRRPRRGPFRGRRAHRQPVSGSRTRSIRLCGWPASGVREFMSSCARATREPASFRTACPIRGPFTATWPASWKNWRHRRPGPSAYGCVGAVVGATYPRELRELRTAMPHAPLLVPGFGSQGGTAADVAGAFDEDGLGALVNNSPRASTSPTPASRTAARSATRNGSRRSRRRPKR